MKQKSLLQCLFLLFALIVGSTNVWADAPDLSSLNFGTPQVSENFNSLSTYSATATVNNSSYTANGAFNKMYNNSTNNTYAIANNNTFSSNVLSLTAGSGSPLIASITGKTFGTKGAFKIRVLKTSTCYVGFYADDNNTAYAKASSSVYIQNSNGTLTINSGSGNSPWQSVGAYTSDIIDIVVIYNNTNTADTYGDGISLGSKKAHIYVNGNCVMNGQTPKAFSIPGASLTAFRVMPTPTTGNTAIVDDIVIYNSLPTPANVAITSIAFSEPKTANVVVGGTTTLSPTVLPANYTETVDWESDDKDVATVSSSGVVTGIAAGTAHIKAKAHNNPTTIYDECTVTVTAPVAVTGVSLKSSTTLLLGGTETLEATILPSNATNKNVMWFSADEAKVSVDEDGVITGLALTNGTPVVITVITEDGDFEAECAVTVNPITVTGVSVKTSTTIEKGKTETLTPTFTPTNATNKNVSWESDDTSVATVSDAGVVTGVAVGTANITVTTEDGGYEATCVVTVTDPKGSATNPYTVEEVNDGTATGDDKYVIGYIVGYFNGKDSDATTTGTSGTVSNVALSDDPSEISGENTIAVQLPNNSTVRTNWNIYNNAVIGYKVLVQGDITSYFTNKTGVKNTSEITAVSIPVAVSAAKYATFASNYKLDFSEVTGLSAYTASASDKTVNFTQVTGSVAAGEGLLLYANVDKSTTYDVPVATDTPSAVENLLKRGTGDALTYAAGTAEYYILANETAGIGFYKANNNTVATNRAYLDLTGANAKSITMPGGETDGIKSVQGSRFTVNGEAYNLAGQRVGKDYKGIVIINGKKYLRK